ncbi:MAG: trehalose-phosphatase [Alphaproteobacteria bacterium]|nr:trehalose-phosphatase [Alphaproteobacteria bacterium]
MPLSELPAPDQNWALFLDVDGTLVEIAATPSAVRITPRVVAMLRHLMDAFGNAVALVSGRSIGVIDQLFEPLRLPVAGLHGLEVRDAKGDLYPAANEGDCLEEIRAALTQYAHAFPGVLLEDKGATLALHYRQAPEQADAARALVSDLLSQQSNYHFLEGKMVLEVKPANVHKGRAVERLLTEPPFAGRLPVYVGDDVTDEDGFTTVNRLGGHSIRVGMEGASAATRRVESVPVLLDWLASLPDAILAKAKPRGSKPA